VTLGEQMRNARVKKLGDRLKRLQNDFWLAQSRSVYDTSVTDAVLQEMGLKVNRAAQDYEFELKQARR